jgi:hypothetical protein
MNPPVVRNGVAVDAPTLGTVVVSRMALPNRNARSMSMAW